jgi:hypothetical protein
MYHHALALAYGYCLHHVMAETIGPAVAVCHVPRAVGKVVTVGRVDWSRPLAARSARLPHQLTAVISSYL